MTKAGRKRKSKARRHPSGKVNSWEDPRAVVQSRRIRDQVRRQINHPHHGFPLGILHLIDFLTDQEFEAGLAWARLAFRFSQVVGIALPIPKAVNWTGSVGLNTGGEPEPEEIARVKAEKARQDANRREHLDMPALIYVR